MLSFGGFQRALDITTFHKGKEIFYETTVKLQQCPLLGIVTSRVTRIHGVAYTLTDTFDIPDIAYLLHTPIADVPSFELLSRLFDRIGSDIIVASSWFRQEPYNNLRLSCTLIWEYVAYVAEIPEVATGSTWLMKVACGISTGSASLYHNTLVRVYCHPGVHKRVHVSISGPQIRTLILPCIDATYILSTRCKMSLYVRGNFRYFISHSSSSRSGTQLPVFRSDAVIDRIARTTVRMRRATRTEASRSRETERQRMRRAQQTDAAREREREANRQHQRMRRAELTEYQTEAQRVADRERQRNRRAGAEMEMEENSILVQ